MDNPIKRSDIYVCGNPQGFTEFTPIAVVMKKTYKSVTYVRYLDHGRIYDRTVMIPTEEFNYYYHPVNDTEYSILKALGYLSFYSDYDEDSEGGLIADD